jgi:uncharacterized protein
MAFFNRSDELAALVERVESSRGEFAVLYGRRRIGKTELILRFAEGRRALFFEATSGTEADHLEDVSRALAEATGRELFAAQPLTSWRAFFTAVAEELANGPLVVALDEFQFVARETRDIGSEINRFWRAHGDNPNLFLILSGSDVSFFEKQVVGYAATTYGRRTGSLRLLPFPPAELRHFLPGWEPADLIRAWAVFGGVPYYLAALDPQASLADNIERVVLRPDALLREEPRFLLGQHSELRDERVYFSILRAIAAGRTRRAEIADRVGRSSDATGQLLDRLIEMGLVRRVHPVTVANPERSRTVRFAIDDPFLRFWFTFVQPFESRLHSRADARLHLDRHVLPRLDDHVSRPAFEQVCHGWLERKVPDATAAGWWWKSVRGPGPAGPRNVMREVDGVAVDTEATVLALASCKWTTAPLPYGELAALRELAPAVIGDSEVPPQLVLFSRSGFDRKLADEAARDPGVRLVDIEELAQSAL